MDSVELILPKQTAQVLPSRPLDKSSLNNASETRKIQVAKDFESLVLNSLLDQMKDTVGDWGFEKDGVSGQIDGIFWLYLARDMADKGGIGLWKNIYDSLPASEGASEGQ